MEAKEKALELKQKFGVATMFSNDNSGYTLSEKTAAKMAIIAVDEIISVLKKSDSLFATNFLANYWIDVKKELEK